jgi:hypothetical protein
MGYDFFVSSDIISVDTHAHWNSVLRYARKP